METTSEDPIGEFKVLMKPKLRDIQRDLDQYFDRFSQLRIKLAAVKREIDNSPFKTTIDFDAVSPLQIDEFIHYHTQCIKFIKMKKALIVDPLKQADDDKIKTCMETIFSSAPAVATTSSSSFSLGSFFTSSSSTHK